jgi:hypothetical protein
LARSRTNSEKRREAGGARRAARASHESARAAVGDATEESPVRPSGVLATRQNHASHRDVRGQRNQRASLDLGWKARPMSALGGGRPPSLPRDGVHQAAREPLPLAGTRGPSRAWTHSLLLFFKTRRGRLFGGGWLVPASPSAVGRVAETRRGGGRVPGGRRHTSRPANGSLARVPAGSVGTAGARRPFIPPSFFVASPSRNTRARERGRCAQSAVTLAFAAPGSAREARGLGSHRAAPVGPSGARRGS